jgi:hypothetical protein
MSRTRSLIPLAIAVLTVTASLTAQATKVDLSKESVGRAPATFEPMVGTWVVGNDGGEKVIKVDGAAYKAAQDPAGRLVLENARKFYGTTNEDLMDNAKQFAFYPIAVLRGVDNFSNGTISVKFKTVAGDSDRASGILFNVKPNGDWLSVRYNDTEHNIAMWEFHNGVRRSIARPATGRNQLADPADRDKWHELRLTIDGASLKTYLNGALVVDYVLGSEPAPGRGGAPPNADLFPANNAVLRPPVMGKIGVWSKTDSTSLFKDFTYERAK